MLKQLFPFVPRSDYETLRTTHQGEYDILSTIAAQQVAKANKERDVVVGLFWRAMSCLMEVDTTRSGGKQLNALRDALVKDAVKAGVWGELPDQQKRDVAS